MEVEDGKEKSGNATHRRSLLLKEVRQLDRIDSAAVPEKLARLHSALVDRSAQSPFHAAEESILRWLLKSMSGNATNLEAEQFRRFPLAWRVMTEAVRHLPLQSLGRCLGDRKFVSVVQQVLRDIASVSAPSDDAKVHATAENANGPHLEIASDSSSGKRSRSDFQEYDLATQQTVLHRLVSAEAVINTLHTVLARLDENGSDVPRNHKAGADHVRSLFFLHAEESLNLIVPLLQVCQLATSSAISDLSSMRLSLWTKTIRSIWKLHLRSHADYIEVAVRSSSIISLLLAILPAGSVRESNFIPKTAMTTDWTADLRNFLIANMILPARNAFMERKDLEAIHMAVTVADQSATVCLPVLFSLVVESSQGTDGVVKTSFEPWVQAVFELLEGSIRAAPPEARRHAMQLMLQCAAGRGSCVSMNVLTTVSEEYGVLADGQDWKVTELIARVDADVFLLPAASKLLAHVLDSTTPEQDVGDEDYNHILTFVMLLAGAYARARDLVEFIKLWYAQLAERPVERTFLRGPSGDQSVWTDSRLSATIASLINSALTAKQFEQISEWILSRQIGDAEPAASAALIVVVACLSDGIASNASEDVIGLRFFEAAQRQLVPEPLASVVVKSRWHIATKTLTWTTLADSTRMWAELQQSLTSAMKEGEVLAQPTFSAFQCLVAIWAAFYPSAPQEQEAAHVVASFLSRLLSVKQDRFSDEELSDLSVDGQAVIKPTRADNVQVGTYQRWLSTNPCHLFSMLLAAYSTEPEVRSTLVEQLFDGDLVQPFLQNCDEALLSFHSASEDTGADQSFQANFTSEVVKRLVNGDGDPELFAKIIVALRTDPWSREERQKLLGVFCGELEVLKEGDGRWELVIAAMIKVMAPAHNLKVEKLNTSSILIMVQKVSENKAAPESTGDNQASGLLEDRFGLAQAFVIQCLESTTWRPSVVELSQAESVLPSGYLVSLTVLQSILRSTSKKLSGREKYEAYLTGEIKQAIVNMRARCENRNEPVAAAFVLTVALQTIAVLGSNAANALSIKSARLVMETADMLCLQGLSMGWHIKALLVARFPDLGSIESGIIVWSSTPPTSPDQGGNLQSRSFRTYCDFVGYVDAVIGHLSAEEALRHIQALLEQTDGVDDNLDARMMAVHRLIEKLPATKEFRNDDFGLATAHALLCRELKPRPTIQFTLVAQCLQLLLELHPSSMNQSAVEMTLMAVSRTASSRTAESSVFFESSANVYTWLCRLTEILLRRHRMRLNGHFHLLVYTLQVLLQRLVQGSEKGTLPRQEKHAKQFARLLTLVCEPMAGTLARSGARVLDSVTDKAKRAAGQYMYLVLLHYIKLLLDRTVPRPVTQALQPGVYAILDITPPEIRKIASEALDTNGRVIFKELYKEYQKFGRWGGV